MKRTLITLFGLISLAFSLTGCSEEEPPKTYTIASQKGAYMGPFSCWCEINFIRENPNGKWMGIEALYGVKYELGYEYVVEGRLLTAEEQFEQDMIADAVDQFTVTSIISKEQKETELPDDKLGSVRRYEEEFLSKK